MGAAAIELDGGVIASARIALGAVADRPIRVTAVEQAVRGPVAAQRAAEAARAALAERDQADRRHPLDRGYRLRSPRTWSRGFLLGHTRVAWQTPTTKQPPDRARSGSVEVDLSAPRSTRGARGGAADHSAPVSSGRVQAVEASEADRPHLPRAAGSAAITNTLSGGVEKVRRAA